jgi:hypothetical protein
MYSSQDDVTERTSIEFRGRISLLFRGNSSSEPQSTAESKAAYSRMNLRMRHDDGKIHEGKVRADGSFVLCATPVDYTICGTTY